MALISKDELLKDSMVSIGYHVLVLLEKAEGDRISLASLMNSLKKQQITRYRPIMFALIFLHSIGAIDFKAPYVYKL